MLLRVKYAVHVLRSFMTASQATSAAILQL